VSPLTPSERVPRSKIGAHLLHALHDSRGITAAARAAFDAKFLDEVDPQRVLPEAERERRPQHARKAHFAKLALVSARARGDRKWLPSAGTHLGEQG
jgi:hypothetical protein